MNWRCSNTYRRLAPRSARRARALARIHRCEQARLLRDAAAILLGERARSLMGLLWSRLLVIDRQRHPYAGAGVRVETWFGRMREATAIAREDGQDVHPALPRARAWLEEYIGSEPIRIERARILLGHARRLDPDPEGDVLVATLGLLGSQPGAGERRARCALAGGRLEASVHAERIRGGLELVRALDRADRGRMGGVLPPLERARRGSDETEVGAIDAICLAVSLETAEWHVARRAALRLESVGSESIPGLLDVVRRTSSCARRIRPMSRHLSRVSTELLRDSCEAAACVTLQVVGSRRLYPGGFRR